MNGFRRWALAGALTITGFVTLGTAQQPPAAGADARDPAGLHAGHGGAASKPDDGDWLMIRRTYDGWGYSPLDQITPANVSRLQPAWVFSTGVSSGHEAAPIVNNGVMFVSTPGNQVIAIDAKTGTLLWRYNGRCRQTRSCCTRPAAASRCTATRSSSPPATRCSSRSTRGPAKRCGPTKVEENKNGYYMTLAPLVADGKVMVGVSGGELGIRGFVAAFDVETGKELWRAYTVPAPGEPGSETWPKGDQWKTGGAPVWVTGNYDPETNLAFWGTGNGGPWMGDQRPGDNLYTASTVAIDVATGQIKGHFQYQPNESWDWDEVSPPILVDYQRNGRTDQGTDQRRAQRLPVVPRAHRRPDQLRRRQAVREAERVPEPRSEDRPARRRSGPQARHRQDARTSARRSGAARTGRRSRSARRRG